MLFEENCYLRANLLKGGNGGCLVFRNMGIPSSAKLIKILANESKK
jgi:hypothetical protein